MPKQGGLFKNLKGKNSKELNRQLIEKAGKPKKSARSVVVGQSGMDNRGLNALMKKVAVATDGAQQMLKEMQEQQVGYTFKLITDEQEFEEYINKALDTGILSIDTEGSGLDPIDDFACGLCLYSPGQQPVYVPFKHTDFQLNIKPGQLNIECVMEQMRRVADASWYDDFKCIFGNAKYDIRMISNTLGSLIKPYWDVIFAGSFLNENEPHGVKYLWDKYVFRGTANKKLKTYDQLFSGIGFNWFDWNKVFQYAANDALMTFQLYEFQKEFLLPDGKYTKDQDLLEASDLYLNTEMPLLVHIAVMENLGVCIDTELGEKLAEKYRANMEKVTKELDGIVKEFDIGKLKKEQRSKLTDPVNIGSPQQLAIILFDLLGFKEVNKRGTGEAVIDTLKEQYPEYKNFFEKIIEYRGLKKMLSTYIEKMPKIVKEKTGRLHTQLNPFGTDTGRFSSKDPNLQNIPAKNKEIRPMFVATEGYYFVSGDYSQQEPRVLAYMSGDEEMIAAYKAGKDLYAWVASVVYQLPYENCLEFHPDTGEVQPEGKKMRQGMKSVVLGLMYGRGASAIAEQLEISRREAQKIIDMFYDAFPKVKQWVEDTQQFCRDNGYVKTAYGRKRRLPDINLPEYEITDMDGNDIDDELVVKHIWNEMDNARGVKAKKEIQSYWRKQGVKIKDNGGFIAHAERQAINSPIQGTGSDIIKRAMLRLAENKRLKELGYRLLLTVHDEIIGEAPQENAKECSEIMEKLMLEACEDRITVPMKVDMEITRGWYLEDLSDSLDAA